METTTTNNTERYKKVFDQLVGDVLLEATPYTDSIIYSTSKSQTIEQIPGTPIFRGISSGSVEISDLSLSAELFSLLISDRRVVGLDVDSLRESIKHELDHLNTAKKYGIEGRMGVEFKIIGGKNISAFVPQFYCVFTNLDEVKEKMLNTGSSENRIKNKLKVYDMMIDITKAPYPSMEESGGSDMLRLIRLKNGKDEYIRINMEGLRIYEDIRDLQNSAEANDLCNSLIESTEITDQYPYIKFIKDKDMWNFFEKFPDQPTLQYAVIMAARGLIFEKGLQFYRRVIGASWPPSEWPYSETERKQFELDDRFTYMCSVFDAMSFRYKTDRFLTEESLSHNSIGISGVDLTKQSMTVQEFASLKDRANSNGVSGLSDIQYVILLKTFLSTSFSNENYGQGAREFALRNIKLFYNGPEKFSSRVWKAVGKLREGDDQFASKELEKGLKAKVNKLQEEAFDGFNGLSKISRELIAKNLVPHTSGKTPAVNDNDNGLWDRILEAARSLIDESEALTLEVRKDH